MKKKRRKPNWKNIIMLLLIIICFIIFINSLIGIIKWSIESNKTKKQIDDIQDIVTITESIEKNENITLIEQENNPDKKDPYWDYINMSLINVDFTNLIELNPHTKGWIQVNGTNINYPFVRAYNNEYYLEHSFDRTKNSAGWVFLDYRNGIEELDKNTIIYAHGRSDTTMFGSLKNILESNWFENKENHVIKISTQTSNTLWQVFSVYKIPTTNDYIRIEFDTNKLFKKWADMLIKRSVFDFNVNVSEKDYVLTLSTCFNEEEKVVMHAKLIKKETR